MKTLICWLVGHNYTYSLKLNESLPYCERCGKINV